VCHVAYCNFSQLYSRNSNVYAYYHSIIFPLTIPAYTTHLPSFSLLRSLLVHGRKISSDEIEVEGSVDIAIIAPVAEVELDGAWDEVC
jgi:hypothetical protein